MGVSVKYLKNIPEAQDNLMLIFEKLIKELRKTEVQNLKAWLYTITKNECLMALRKNKNRSYSAIDTLQFENEESTIEKLKEKERLLTLLEEVIPALKENQRVCIELFYLNKKSYSEIAKQTQYTLKEVKSNIQNGKRNLELMMNELNSNP
jgi:RNA polymerase sigma factor (sigma-70 family)